MLFIRIFILLSLLNCSDKKKSTTIKEVNNNIDGNTIVTERGFLFIDISEIYHRDGELSILDKDKKSKFEFVKKRVLIDCKDFEIIDEEYLYKNLVNVESFDPEYGLFILEVKSTDNQFYEVLINEEAHFIDLNKYADVLKFKTEEQYVLESYPNPTLHNPLRVQPNVNSYVIENYKNFTFIAVEIKGDWLKIKDDKDCYPNEEPSKKDIIGWVRWRKNGKIILDIRHSC